MVITAHGVQAVSLDRRPLSSRAVNGYTGGGELLQDRCIIYGTD